MKKYLLLIGFSFFTALSFGQITFEKYFSEYPNGLGFRYAEQTKDSGYIIVGIKKVSTSETQHIILVKTDSTGAMTNSAEFGSDNFTEGQSIQQTYDGGYIVGGETNDFGNTYSRPFLIKTNASFDTLWTRLYNAPNITSHASTVRQTSDSGFIFTGWINFLGSTLKDIYLFKSDKNGITVFRNVYTMGDTSITGNCLRPTTDHGYIISGSAFTDADTSVYLLKTDSAGNIEWAKTYGGSGKEEGNGVEQTFDGGYIIAGYTTSFDGGRASTRLSSSPNNDDNIYLTKTDANGGVTWTKKYVAAHNDMAYSVHQTADSGYIITGETWPSGTTQLDGNICLIKTNSLGDLLWSKSITTGKIGNSVQEASDGGLIDCVFGYTNPYSSLIKTDANGSKFCSSNNLTMAAVDVLTEVRNTETVLADSSGSDGTAGFSPYNIFITETDCTPVATKEVSSNENTFAVYPNPAADHIILRRAMNDSNGDAIISIMNVLGEQLISFPIGESQEKTFDVSMLSTGIYFLQLKTSNGIEVKKFAKN